MGCSSVWPECLVWNQDVAGSNPVTPITEKIMIDYWRMYIDDDWISGLCGGCDYDVMLDWDDKIRYYVLPNKCPLCGWVPTKFCP